MKLFSSSASDLIFQLHCHRVGWGQSRRPLKKESPICLWRCCAGRGPHSQHHSTPAVLLQRLCSAPLLGVQNAGSSPPAPRSARGAAANRAPTRRAGRAGLPSRRGPAAGAERRLGRGLVRGTGADAGARAPEERRLAPRLDEGVLSPQQQDPGKDCAVARLS